MRLFGWPNAPSCSSGHITILAAPSPLIHCPKPLQHLRFKFTMNPMVPTELDTKEFSMNTMPFGEIASLAIDSFRSAKVRFMLTALGMCIGTASLILVVTIGMTGKQYIMSQIQAIGANMIYAYYEGGSNSSFSTIQKDELTEEDVRAIRQEVTDIVAASPN